MLDIVVLMSGSYESGPNQGELFTGSVRELERKVADLIRTISELEDQNAQLLNSALAFGELAERLNARLGRGTAPLAAHEQRSGSNGGRHDPPGRRLGSAISPRAPKGQLFVVPRTEIREPVGVIARTGARGCDLRRELAVAQLEDASRPCDHEAARITCSAAPIQNWYASRSITNSPS